MSASIVNNGSERYFHKALTEGSRQKERSLKLKILIPKANKSISCSICLPSLLAWDSRPFRPSALVMTISFFLHIPPHSSAMGWPLQAKYGKPGWFGGISANLVLICNNVARGMKQPKDLYPRTLMAIRPLVCTPVTSLHVSCAHSWCGPNVNIYIYGPVIY